jgi:hypothetical protein
MTTLDGSNQARWNDGGSFDCYPRRTRQRTSRHDWAVPWFSAIDLQNRTGPFSSHRSPIIRRCHVIRVDISASFYVNFVLFQWWFKVLCLCLFGTHFVTRFWIWNLRISSCLKELIQREIGVTDSAIVTALYLIFLPLNSIEGISLFSSSSNKII